MSASNRARAPSAIASATCGETAPCSAIRFAGTPSSSVFASSGTRRAAREVRGGAGAIGQPRGEQPAGARLREPDPVPGQKLGHLIVDRLPVAAEHEAAVSIRNRVDHSIRERLVLGQVADVHHELRLAQAGRDLQRREVDLFLDLAQRLRELRLRDPEHAKGRGRIGVRASGHRAHRLGLERSWPERVQLARRAGSTTTTVPSAGTTRPGAVPAGSIGIAPGTKACFRFASRIASGSKL